MTTILILAAMFGIAGISWITTKIHQHQLDIEQILGKQNQTEPVTRQPNRWE